MFKTMKVKPLLSLILFSLFFTTSFGKIIFEPRDVYGVNLVKHFFQDNIFPDIKYVKVVNFGSYKGDFQEVQVLLKNLNDEHSKATIVFSDFNQTVLKTHDRVFLILLTTDYIEETLEFIDQISFKGLELINAVILLNREFSQEEFTMLYEKPRATNFDQIIYAFPSFDSPTDDVFFQVDHRTLVFYLENMVLSKLTSTWKIVKFIMNADKINSTLNRLRLQQERYMEEINKFPIKVLLYLRPLSVEKNPSNSIKPYKGVEIKMLEILADSLRSPYTVELGQPKEFGTYYTNNTPTRAFTDVRNGNFDLSINRYLLMNSEEGMGLMPYDQEEFCFVMLMPENQLRKWSVLMPFKTSVWISLLLTNVAVYTIYMFIREKNWKVIWLFQSSISVSQLPATRHSHRMLWSVWLLFNVVMCASYTCFFVTQLVPRKKHHTYRTIQELITRNITLLSEVGHFQDIQTLFTDNQLTSYYGQPQHINKTSALLTSYLTRLKLIKVFGSQFYKVEECLPSRTVGPLMSTRNPNLKNTARIVKQVLAAGINRHWIEIYLHAAILSGNMKNIDSKSYKAEEYSPLRTKELENIFNYFILGLVFSGMVFLYELLHFEITKPRIKVRPEIVRVFPYTD